MLAVNELRVWDQEWWSPLFTYDSVVGKMAISGFPLFLFRGSIAYNMAIQFFNSFYAAKIVMP